MGASLRRVPAWAWLTAIVAGSILFRWWFARGMVAPFIMVDELIYAELARSLAAGGGLEVRGEPYLVSLLYPLLLAPAYLVSDSLVDGYAAVKAINAAVMSLAAVPAYLLARRLLPAGLSVLAALLAVALPSLVYTGTVMTENLFYPAFLLFAWALVRMLERPTAASQLLVLALGLAVVLIRVQGVALVLAALTAPLVVRRPLRPYAPLYAIALGGAAALVLAQLARGSSPASLLGAYRVVGESGYDLGHVARYLLWHVAELDLYLGVFPAIAFVLLLFGVRALDEPARAFMAAAGALSLWVLLVVSAFASQFASNRIQERNMFFLAPLFLIALLVWVDRGAPRPRPAAVAAALGLGALPAVIPYERFIETGAVSDTLMLLPLWNLQDRITLPRVDETVLAVGLAAAVAFLLLPRRWALALPIAVLLYFALAFRPVAIGAHGLRFASEGALFTGIRVEDRDWIDRAVPEDAEVALLWTGRPDRFTVNQNEFFNSSIGPIYTLRGPVPGNLPETPVEIGEDGVVRAGGDPVRAEYVLTDGSVDPDGAPVARDRALGLTLTRTSGVLVSTTKIDGMYEDQWSGPEVVYRRVRCEGGSLTVVLDSDANLFARPQTIVATSRGGARVSLRLPPTAQRRMTVPLRPEAGVCAVRFTISPTKVPGPHDDRRLGVHFRAFEYRAP